MLRTGLRPAAIAASVVAATVAGGAWAATAPTVGGGPGLFPTTSAPTTAKPTSTTTVASSTTSTTPTGSPTPDAGAAPYDPTVGSVPPMVAAWLATIPRSGPNNTGGLILALSPLATLGFTPLQAAVVGFGRFPVAGYTSWRDDWMDPRFAPDGSLSFHTGNDLVASCGTPLRSPTYGVLTESQDPGGGYTVEVTQPDRTYFYLAHLSAYVLGLQSGQKVNTGDIIGFVGRSGSATGCHLHIEVHPFGGSAVDPKPLVDSWVAEATANAPRLIDAERRAHGLAPEAASLPASTTTSTTAPAAGTETLLFASAANPSGGALVIAQDEAAKAVRAAGTSTLLSQAEAATLAWEEDELAADALLAPTTPPALRRFLGVG